MLTQREYDIRQLESELKIQAAFEEWKKAFLKGRMMPQQQQIPAEMMPPQAPGVTNGVPTEPTEQAGPVVPTEQYPA